MWKTINEEPNYEVSSDGKIRRKKTKHVKSLRKDKNGYLRVTLYPSGKTYSIHRLVAKTFIPCDEEGLTVNHINGNKEDNRVENLEWCSSKENTLHAIRNGLFKIRDIKGVKNPSAVMTEELVVDIKYGKYSSLTSKEIADITGLRYEAIRRVKTGQNWSHI